MFKFVSLLIAYLIFVSVFLGYVVMEKENKRIDTLAGTAIKADFVDFSGETDFDMVLDNSISYGDSIQKIDNKLFVSTPALGDIAIYFKGIQKNTNGNYRVVYNISNTNDDSFDIIIASAPKAILQNKMLYMHFDKDKTEMQIQYNTMSVLDRYNPFIYYKQNLNLAGTHTIETDFNPETKNLVITIDDIVICNVKITDYDIEATHFAGVVVFSDLWINSVSANIIYQEESTTNILSVIAQIIIFNVDEMYLPNLLNVIFIKIPILILSIAIPYILIGGR